jgi:hypothetical protein
VHKLSRKRTGHKYHLARSMFIIIWKTTYTLSIKIKTVDPYGFLNSLERARFGVPQNTY